MGPLRAFIAVLACCGVKLVVLAAVLAPSGFLTRNVWLGVLGLALAAGLVAVSVRRRRRCDGACHVPAHAHDAPPARVQR